MSRVRVAILGAGPAGCAAAVLLARRGHEVVVVDRDDHPSAAPPDELFAEWDRPGVGQFRQPHNFLGRGRTILRTHLPDVYAALLAAGAGEIRQDTFLGTAPREPADEELATIACRRPLIDAALRAAVAREESVTFHAVTATGLAVRPGPPPHVWGVRVATGVDVSADLVVDAMGRNSPVPRWLEQAGATPWVESTDDSRLLYYSRHYRFRGDPPPYASILGGPRGDVGYLAYAVFLGDNDTFCLCVMTPVWEKEWRDLRREDAFDRVARTLPSMAPWLDAAEPISDVLPMGQLRNTLQRTVTDDGDALATGLVPIGDARCHTNPTFAFGLSLALSHALALAETVDSAADRYELTVNFEAAVGPEAASRFAAVSAEDRDRIRLWTGQPIDPSDRHDSMPLFLRSVVYRSAAKDPDILRAVCRRINLLDPVEALAADSELLDRAELLYRQLPPAPTPPGRVEMLAELRGDHG